MTERPSYKTTLFDRLGPDAGGHVQALAWGFAVGGALLPVFIVGAIRIYGLSVIPGLLVGVLASVVMGALVSMLPIVMGNAGGSAMTAVVAGGNTTPYIEQYSYQQALVMQGRLDEALSTYEAIIAEQGSTLDVRIRAAELYAREAKNHQRAAELFREVIRDPRCTVGEEVYSANRLVDLLNGPLAQPGRALVELGRLADRYPKSLIGQRARQALRSLKAVAAERDQPVG